MFGRAAFFRRPGMRSGRQRDRNDEGGGGRNKRAKWSRSVVES